MNTSLFIENHILEQKNFLFIHISNKLVKFNCFKKIKSLSKKNNDIKEKQHNTEKVNSEKKEGFDNNHDKYKSDLSIITDGFCS